jgi:hypothetical protein
VTANSGLPHYCLLAFELRPGEGAMSKRIVLIALGVVVLVIGVLAAIAEAR